MNTQQAYIDGFVKRASEYGFNKEEAEALLKQAGALTVLNKMKAVGVHPRILNKILSSRKNLADEIRYSRNMARPWSESSALQESFDRPSRVLRSKGFPTPLDVHNEQLRSAMDDIYYSSPRNFRGVHQNILSPALETEALARLRPSRNLPSKVLQNIERKL